MRQREAPAGETMLGSAGETPGCSLEEKIESAYAAAERDVRRSIQTIEEAVNEAKKILAEVPAGRHLGWLQ